MMKRINVFLIFIISIIFLSGCGRNHTADNDFSATGFNSDANSGSPAFEITDVPASAGEKDIVLTVRIKNNPGFLTMAVNIVYDSNAMTLTKTVNGSGFSEYNFINPKNLKSGCTASWFKTDLPDKIVDGDLLVLHFTILENVKSGDYSITISCPDDGGIVDGNKESFLVENSTGYIKVK